MRTEVIKETDNRNFKIEDGGFYRERHKEESLARVRRRLRGKFGVKIHSIQYVWSLEDVKLSWLILGKCVILSHFIIHQGS